MVENVPMEQIRSVYETNVFGLIRLTQAVIPGMKAKRSGHIINVGTIGGFIGKLHSLYSDFVKKK